MTANNPTWSDELARRVVPIRLVPETDRPEFRAGFRHPELEPWVATHRADLLWSLAVFVRVWLAEGSPVPATQPLGSFEVWTRVVGGILETARYREFLANREDILSAGRGSRHGRVERLRRLQPQDVPTSDSLRR